MNPKDLSPSCIVEHQVRYYRHPSLAWLNLRWPISEGVNVTDETALEQFKQTVLDNYAFGRPSETQDLNDFLNKEETVYADRYGATGGSHFGGSGRCSIKDNVIIKGTGRTALAAEHADHDHRNGLIDLGEAIREVVYSEMFYRELPHRSVPVLAVIDTGTTAFFDEEGDERRVALVIRPFFVRPAHFERSVFFDHYPQHNHTSQPIDADRVRHYTSVFGRHRRRFFETMWQGIVEQKAAERVLRLWSGRFLTSNMEVTGRSVDFGMATSLPGWRRYYHHSQESFGEDTDAIVYGMRSTFEQISKYSHQQGVDQNTQAPAPEKANSLLHQFKAKVDNDLCSQFNIHLRKIFHQTLFNDPRSYNHFIETLSNTYKSQQKVAIPLLSRDGVGELDDPAIVSDNFLVDHACEVYCRLRLEEYSDVDKTSLKYIRFIFSNRETLYYSILRKDICTLCDRLSNDTTFNFAVIDDFVSTRLADNRRYLPALKDILVPSHIWTNTLFTIVKGETRGSSNVFIYIEATVSSGWIYIANKRYRCEILEPYCEYTDDNTWYGFISQTHFEKLEYSDLSCT